MSNVNVSNSSLTPSTSITKCIKYRTKQGTPKSKVTKLTTYQNNAVTVTSETNVHSLYLSKYRMNKDTSFERKLLEILEDFELTYQYLLPGIDVLHLVLQNHKLQEHTEAKLIERIRTELAVDDLTIKHDLALIKITAKNKSSNTTCIASATKALAENNINLEMTHMDLSQSHINLVFGVAAEDEKRAIAAVSN